MKIEEPPVVTYSPTKGKEFLVFFRIDSEDDLLTTAKKLVQLGRNHISDRTLDEKYILDSIRKMKKMSRVDLSETKFQLSYDNAGWSVSIDWEQIDPKYYPVFGTKTDSEGNLYREIVMNEDKIVRITKVQKSDGKEVSIRIQTRQVGEEQPEQGPEIPIEHLDKITDTLQFITAAQEALDDLASIDLENDPQWQAAREEAWKEAQHT